MNMKWNQCCVLCAIPLLLHRNNNIPAESTCSWLSSLVYMNTPMTLSFEFHQMEAYVCLLFSVEEQVVEQVISWSEEFRYDCWLLQPIWTVSCKKLNPKFLPMAVPSLCVWGWVYGIYIKKKFCSRWELKPSWTDRRLSSPSNSLLYSLYIL